MSAEKATSPRLTWFKEAVTACLGVMIIVGMFLLLWPLLTKDSPDITNAQAIFSILGGWGGIVLGYYFGRLPAERVAAKAEAAAAAAEVAKDTAVVGAKTTLTETKSMIARDRETLEEYMKLITSLRKRIDEL